MSVQKYTNSYIRLSKISRNRSHTNNARILTKSNFKFQNKKQEISQKDGNIQQNPFLNQQKPIVKFNQKNRQCQEQVYEDNNDDQMLIRSQTLDISSLQSNSNLFDVHNNDKTKIKNKIKDRLKLNAQILRLKTKRNTNENQIFNHFSVSQLQLLNYSQKRNFKTISTSSQKNQLNYLINKPSNLVLDIPKLISQKIKSEGCQQKTLQSENIFNKTLIKKVNINNLTSIQRLDESNQRKNSTQIKSKKKTFGFKPQYLNQLHENKQIALYNYFFKQNGAQMQMNKKIYFKPKNKSAPKYLIVYSLNQTIQNAKLQLLQEQQKMRKQKKQFSKKHQKILQSIKQEQSQSYSKFKDINKKGKNKKSEFEDIEQYPELNQWEISQDFSPWLIE